MVNRPHIISQNKAKRKVDQSGDPTDKILYLEMINHLKVAIRQAKLNPLESLESQSWRVPTCAAEVWSYVKTMFGCTRAINLCNKNLVP